MSGQPYLPFFNRIFQKKRPFLIEKKAPGAEEALTQLTGVANNTPQIPAQSSSTSTSSAPVSHELQLENAQLKKIIEDQAMALNAMSDMRVNNHQAYI